MSIRQGYGKVRSDSGGRMSALCFLIALFVAFPEALTAQEAQAGDGAAPEKTGLPLQASNLAIGASLAQRGEDFTLGLQVTSPYLLDVVALRLSGELAFRNGIPEGGDQSSWQPYGIMRFGLVGGTGALAPNIRLYGEGGGILVITDPSFSTVPIAFGGYGHFGFEFFFGTINGKGLGSYYIELGSTGSGLSADRMVGKSIFLNGFSVSTGIRVYL